MNLLKQFTYFLIHVFTLGNGVKVRFSGFSVKLPSRYFRYFTENYEDENFSFLQKVAKPGHVVIDIGAHLGLFSVRAAQLVGDNGKVFAFEPAPSTFLLLKKTIQINKVGTIVVPVQAAVADQKGKTKFFVSDTIGDVANSLVDYDDNIHHGYDVEVICCDDFVRDNNIKVNFLKIDAEGAELHVLKGAVRILKEHRPYCILAMHPDSILKFGDSNTKIWDYLLDLPYTIYHQNQKIDRETFCAKQNLFDVHLIPGDSLMSISELNDN